MKRITKLIILSLLVVFALMQLYKIKLNIQEHQPGNDYLTMANVPDDIGKLLINSCYDCHSDQPKLPWYSNVAPASWIVRNHINDGRRHLNFSRWNEYSLEKQIHKQEECFEELEENKMPLKSYTALHSDAKLTNEEKQKLIEWFKNFEYDQFVK